MSGHVAPKSMYIGVWLALVAGTILTYLAALVDLGALNNVVMLLIACTKASLVILFFMHVRWSSRLTWVVAASGFFWLLILFGLTMQDYLTRGCGEGRARGVGSPFRGPRPPFAALPDLLCRGSSYCLYWVVPFDYPA